MKLLNLGCDRFKLPKFINIDINPQVSPDLCIDLKDLNKHFEIGSIDFIFAGHVLEHFEISEAQQIVTDCFKLLKPFSVMLSVVPDWSKCEGYPLELVDRVILAGGAHKSVYNIDRLSKLFLQAGFKTVAEIKDLKQVPYILVSNILDPKPDPWQSALIALKI